MKTFRILLLMCATSITTLAGTNLSPSLNGAWLTTYTNEDGKAITGEATFMEGYFSMAAYAVATKEFYYTKGGRYTVKENQLSLTWEFNTQDKSQVGKLVTETIQLKKDKLELGGHSWQRLDDGTPGVLAGAWLITGRKRNGELTRSTPGVRKTMKILSGTRFQWIAYNTETGEFFGTGGGTYTTKDGNYTENIEFFSRDASRVGVSLPFEYTLEDGEWHHSGLTSKGQPMYEIWTPRSRLE